MNVVIESVDYFQDDGVIVSTRGRKESENKVYEASKFNTLVNQNIPVIVLIDKGSASASEIFSGALKDTKRGILIGEKSYGKGSVQTIFQLVNDGFKLTIAKYYTPSNISIDGIGIEPNLEVKGLDLNDDEKQILKKIYDNKIIEKFVSENPNPSAKDIDDYVKGLINKGYIISDKYLKKLIKNAVEIDNSEKPIYDLDFDTPLQKAIEVFDKGMIKSGKDGYYLDLKK